jgi:hypothetical protein
MQSRCLFLFAHRWTTSAARRIVNSSGKTLNFAHTSASSARVIFKNRRFRRHRCARFFFAREKEKQGAEMRRAKPRKNQGFRAHISASLGLEDFHILTAQSFRSHFLEQNDLASRSTNAEVPVKFTTEARSSGG